MDNLQWLLKNGGPAIKLCMINKGLISKDEYDANILTDELLQIENVSKALSYFDQFKNYRLIPDRELWGLVHNCYENCFEMFAPFLVRAGFCKGIAVLDDKIEIMRDVYKHLMETYDFHGLNIISILLSAGYLFNDMEEYITSKVEKNHKITNLNTFDFYETDESKIRQPKKWKGYLIIKDKYNPHGGEYPLPTSYDVELFLAYYKVTGNEAVKRKIDDIMRFIMRPEYQKTGGDNGWHWAEQGKTYHASSSGWSLPIYFNEEFEPAENQKWHFLSKLNTMSLSPIIVESEYFNKCICYLEQYKTECGTYRFPDAYMLPVLARPSNPNTACELFVSGDVLPTLKKNSRKVFMFEVYSTFYMEMLKNRLRP